MAFKEGISGNPNGRPRGKPNKTTDKTKRIILACSEKYTQKQFTEDMNSLKPYERLQIITKLWHIVLPKNIELFGELETKGPRKIGYF